VWSKENAEAMLSAGALAVQVDAALWNPATHPALGGVSAPGTAG